MTSTISCKRYIEYNKIISAVDSMAKKVAEFRETMSSDMYDLTQVDPAPDLTDIHPRDRKNVKILCGALPFDGNVAKDSNDTIGVWNACFGITVPSTDSNMVGIEVNGEVYSHGHNVDVTFDPQTPHQAWNHTNEWWTMLILNIDKRFFI